MYVSSLFSQAFIATGTNLQLVFSPCANGYSDGCDFEKEQGKVSVDQLDADLTNCPLPMLHYQLSERAANGFLCVPRHAVALGRDKNLLRRSRTPLELFAIRCFECLYAPYNVPKYLIFFIMAAT